MESNYISMRTMETRPRADSGRDWARSVAGIFCRRILQVWGRLGGRDRLGGKDSLGEGWVPSPRECGMPARPSGPFPQKLEWRWFTGCVCVGEPGDPKWSQDFTESLFLPSPCDRSPLPPSGSSCAERASLYGTFLPSPPHGAEWDPRVGTQWPLTPHHGSAPVSCLVPLPAGLSLSAPCPAFCSVLPGVHLPFLVVTLLTHGTRLPHPAALTQPKLP